MPEELIRNAPPKPARGTALLKKAKAKTDQATTQRKVYATVNARDKYRCRACGDHCHPYVSEALKKGHHHHVRFRSRGGADHSSNVCLLCAFCHAFVHDHKLIVTGNADSSLTCSTEERTWDSPVP